MMKKNKLSLILIIVCSVCLSCTDAVKKDAQKAADLTEKSKEAAENYNFELSDSFFKEYKEIENRYTNSDKKEEFEHLYCWYMTQCNQNN